MVIWSYLVIEQRNAGWSVAGDSTLSFGDQVTLTEVLNAAGEKGWELTGLTAANAGAVTYVFKRQVDIGEDAEEG